MNAAYQGGLLENVQEFAVGKPLSREDFMIMLANSLDALQIRVGDVAKPAEDVLGVYSDAAQLSPAGKAAAARCIQAGRHRGRRTGF